MTSTLFAGLLGFVVTLFCAHGRVSQYNNYVLFAQSLLQGHLWIAWPGPYIDAVLFDGHRYIVNDPVPGLLLLPFVAIFGSAANQTLLACGLAGVSTAATWSLCRRLGASARDAAWLTAFALAGTDLLWASMLGDVWFIAQTSCFAFLTLALVELAGKRRGWLVTLLFVLAAGSRFTVVMALPVIAYWLATGFFARDVRLRSLRSAALTFFPFVLLWIGYNEARWHVPWDSGHTIFYHEDSAGSAVGSPFSLGNLQMQLNSFFSQGVTFTGTFPYVIPGQGGVALTYTSPALVLAFFARGPQRIIAGAWVATVLVAGPSLLYYVNGFAQFGMRHALDFEPFLIILMALAAHAGLHLLSRILISWSIFMGLWGTWFWNTVYRSGQG